LQESENVNKNLEGKTFGTHVMFHAFDLTTGSLHSRRNVTFMAQQPFLSQFPQFEQEKTLDNTNNKTKNFASNKVTFTGAKLLAFQSIMYASMGGLKPGLQTERFETTICAENEQNSVKQNCFSSEVTFNHFRGTIYRQKLRQTNPKLDFSVSRTIEASALRRTV